MVSQKIKEFVETFGVDEAADLVATHIITALVRQGDLYNPTDVFHQTIVGELRRAFKKWGLND
jgi:hypothetical protein